jgi:Flp pilus assembly protein TadD
MGDYADAEQVLNEAIAILPTASGFHALLGTLMLRQGRKSDARVAYRDALRYEPDHAGYRSQLEQLAEV